MKKFVKFNSIEIYFKIIDILYTNYKNKFIFLIFIGLLSSFFEILSFIILPALLSILINLKSINDFSFINSLDIYTKSIISKNLQIFILSLLFSIALLKLVLNYYFNWLQNRLIFSLNNNFSSNLFKSILNKNYSFFLSNKSSVSTTLLTHEYEMFIQFFTHGMVLILELFIISGTLFSLFLYNFLITFQISVFLIISILLFNFFQKFYLNRLSKKRNELINNKYNIITQTFRNIKDVKIFELENILSYYYNKNTKLEGDIKRKLSFLHNMPRNYIELVVFSSIIFLFLIINFYDKNFNNLIPTISLFIFALFRLLPSINKVINAIQFASSSSNSFLSIISELNVFKHQLNINKNLNIKYIFKKNIVFNNLSFYYNNGSKKVFNNLNLEFYKGQKIGILGESGSGKTTFIDLLLGLLKPTNGTILIDGIDLQLLDKSWKHNIGYVQQNILLFNLSIKENIAIEFENENIDHNKIQFLMNFVNLNSQLHINDVNTNIGDNGCNLSGGQRQRIAIARALYRDPQILIFDEATSALDEKNESNILKSIFEYNPDITIFIISHKKSTLSYCDKIYSIKNYNFYLNN
jgi:ABC-type multidrug transport system fused ATPase/permease subunit